MNIEAVKIWASNNYYKLDGSPNSNIARMNYCESKPEMLKFHMSVLNLTKWLDDYNPKFSTRVKSILIGESTVKRCTCGGHLKISTNLSQSDSIFNKFCSTKCARNDPETKRKQVETSISRYGVSNPSLSKVVSEKISTKVRIPFNSALIRYKQNYPHFTFDASDDFQISGIVNVTCSKHNISFIRSSGTLLAGETNCPECRADSLRDKYMLTTDEYVERLAEVRGDEFTLVGEYLGMHSINTFMCKDGHIFECVADHIVGTNRGNCPQCYAGSSVEEQSLITFIKSLTDDVIVNSRKHLGNGKEIDAIVGSVMFEYNGLYWHSSEFLTNNYHLDKTIQAESNGYQLFHIWSHEWKNEAKCDIWKSIISNALKLAKYKLHARKCEVKLVEQLDYVQFMNDNHIQGYAASTIKLGLYYDDELVSAMGFSIPRFDKSCDYELVRFANKKYTSVVGGASKLLKAFRRMFPNMSIVSYADRRLSSGALYRTLGFEFMHHSAPSYFYSKDWINTISRYSTRRSKLPALLSNFDSSLSETENMNANGYFKIFDCGTSVWILR